LRSGRVIPSSEQLKKHVYCKWHNFYSHATNDCNIFHRQVQSTINEERLKFAESPQMKLDKDPFPVNMNMVELEGKKVLVRHLRPRRPRERRKSLEKNDRRG
jgi:hypothetical protein